MEGKNRKANDINRFEERRNFADTDLHGQEENILYWS